MMMMYYLKAYVMCTMMLPLLTSAFVLPSHPSPSRPSSSLLAVDGQSSSSSSQQRPSGRSIWASSQWNFTFNLGREPGSLMDGDWGAAGGRLIFDLPVEATSDNLSTDKEDAMLQRNANKLIPLSNTKYAANEGEEKEVAFVPSGGEWKIQLPRGVSDGKAGKLMCYFDLKTSIRKDDIFLDKGDRIYLTGKCWREQELDRALARLQPYQENYRHREEKMNKALIEKDYGYERLIIDRDMSLGEYQEANIYFPTIDDDISEFSWTKEELEWQEGYWPGEGERLTVEPLFLMVRRMKLFVKEEYHVIGTWAATPAVEEGEEE